MKRILILVLPLLLACPTVDDDDSGPPDDDDSASTADDDDACGLPSGGGGGPSGTSWHEVDGFGTPGDDAPDYELFVHVPDGLDLSEAAPVLMLVGRRMPLDRAQNEQILFDMLAMGDLVAEQGWVLTMPLPGEAAPDQLSWTDSATDEAFFDAALEQLGAGWNIDLDRINGIGASAGGSAAVMLAYKHGDRLAGILNQAGANPYAGGWPPTPWPADCAGLFVHDEDDPVVPRGPVEDGALMFEDAGQQTERAYDYPSGHEWDADALGALMADFFGRTCNR